MPEKNNEIDKNLYIILFPNFSVIKKIALENFSEKQFLSPPIKKSS
jgi:hypothetical protein